MEVEKKGNEYQGYNYLKKIVLHFISEFRLRNSTSQRTTEETRKKNEIPGNPPRNSNQSNDVVHNDSEPGSTYKDKKLHEAKEGLEIIEILNRIKAITNRLANHELFDPSRYPDLISEHAQYFIAKSEIINTSKIDEYEAYHSSELSRGLEETKKYIQDLISTLDSGLYLEHEKREFKRQGFSSQSKLIHELEKNPELTMWPSSRIGQQIIGSSKSQAAINLTAWSAKFRDFINSEEENSEKYLALKSKVLDFETLNIGTVNEFMELIESRFIAQSQLLNETRLLNGAVGFNLAVSIMNLSNKLVPFLENYSILTMKIKNFSARLKNSADVHHLTGIEEFFTKEFPDLKSFSIMVADDNSQMDDRYFQSSLNGLNERVEPFIEIIVSGDYILYLQTTKNQFSNLLAKISSLGLEGKYPILINTYKELVDEIDGYFKENIREFGSTLLLLKSVFGPLEGLKRFEKQTIFADLVENGEGIWVRLN